MFNLKHSLFVVSVEGMDLLLYEDMLLLVVKFVLLCIHLPYGILGNV